MSFNEGFRVKYFHGTKQITLLRNILAGLIYDSRGISLEDTLVLYDLLPMLIEKSEKDPQFNKSHGSGLITTYGIIKTVEFNPTSFPYKPKGKVVQKLKSSLFGWIPSEAAYYSWARNPRREKSYSVIPESLTLRLPKKTKELTRIGVGYRDKGMLKNPAVNGDPGWKEVARKSGEIEGLIIDKKISDVLTIQRRTTGREYDRIEALLKQGDILVHS